MVDFLRIESDLGATIAAALGYRSGRDAVLDARGRTVRCTPRRRTSMIVAPGGETVFCKERRGGSAAAAADAEVRRLRELGGMGFTAPAALFTARWRRRTVVATRAVDGRPLDAWIAEEPTAAVRYAIGVVAPAVARLHAAGLCYRDLYWNHLFTSSIEPPAPPSWIDVERVFRPRWRRRRWVVKDLAGLLASWPGEPPELTDCVRFLRAYGGERLPAGWRALGAAVARKAARIRAHRPKYG